MQHDMEKLILGCGIIILWAIALASIKGCHDSNNALYKAAVDRGCSVIHEEVICPGLTK